MNAFTNFAPRPMPSNPFSAAGAKLRAAGYDLLPSEIPGLTIVTGPGVYGDELTMGQIMSFGDRF